MEWIIDGVPEEEMKQEVERLRIERNKFLISKGYIITEDGSIFLWIRMNPNRKKTIRTDLTNFTDAYWRVFPGMHWDTQSST